MNSRARARALVGWVLGFASLALVYLFIAIETPLSVGLWQDDATYVATARSLAEGSGYRHIQIPSQPLQTHYPPLYAAMLAVGFRLSADYPDNLPWLLVPNALAVAALIMLSMCYWRRVFDAPAAVWGIAAALSAISPFLLSFLRYTMSDLVYAALAVGALLCLDAPRSQESKDSNAFSSGLIAGAVLVGLAVLTRSVGVSLLIAAPATLVLRRRFRDALLCGAVSALVCLPWWLWQASATAENGSIQTAFLTASELNYGLWLPEGVEPLLRVIQQNLVRLLFSVSYYPLALPIDWTQLALSSFGWRTVALYGVCSFAMLALIVGFVASARRCWSTVHLYGLIYAGLAIVWPFEPHRLLVPWTPFILFFMVAGLAALSAWSGARLSGAMAADLSDRASRGQTMAIVAFAFVVAWLFVQEDLAIVTSRPEAYFVRQIPGGMDLTEVEEVYDFVRQHVPEDEIVASAWPAGLYLNTQRRGHFLWPDVDPYRRYYGVDGEAWRLYSVRTKSELRSIYEEVAADLITTYNDASIHYYLHQPNWLEALVMEDVANRHPELFELLFRSSKGSYRLYRLHFPPTSPTDS